MLIFFLIEFCYIWLAMICPMSFLRTFVRKIFCKLLSKYLWQSFFLEKISCFQYILLNTFRWMHLYFGNCSLKSILFQTLKQHSDYKSLITKTFDGNTLKMKALNTIQVIKSRKQFFQLCLVQTCTLVQSNEKFGAQKEICPPLRLDFLVAEVSQHFGIYQVALNSDF